MSLLADDMVPYVHVERTLKMTTKRLFRPINEFSQAAQYKLIFKYQLHILH